MRLHRRLIASVALLVMCVVAPVAGAVSGPGANENSKFVYTEQLGAGLDLVLTFDEGSQKRFESVGYQLDGEASHFQICDGQGAGTAGGVGAEFLEETLHLAVVGQDHVDDVVHGFLLGGCVHRRYPDGSPACDERPPGRVLVDARL